MLKDAKAVEREEVPQLTFCEPHLYGLVVSLSSRPSFISSPRSLGTITAPSAGKGTERVDETRTLLASNHAFPVRMRSRPTGSLRKELGMERLGLGFFGQGSIVVVLDSASQSPAPDDSRCRRCTYRNMARPEQSSPTALLPPRMCATLRPGANAGEEQCRPEHAALRVLADSSA